MSPLPSAPRPRPRPVIVPLLSSPRPCTYPLIRQLSVTRRLPLPSPHPPLLRGRSGRVLDMVATTPRMVATERHLHSIIDRRRDGGGTRLGAARCCMVSAAARPPSRTHQPHTLAHASSHSQGFGFNTSSVTNTYSTSDIHVQSSSSVGGVAQSSTPS